MVYEVRIEIGASPSNYWALVQFEDKAGRIHERKVGAGREASKNSNTLQALIEAVKILNKTCMISIYSSSEYLVEPFRQGWVQNWEKHGWKNAKGNEVRNANQWKELRAALAPHTARFLYPDGRR